MLKNEWKKLFQSKFMIAVMVAIILIPTIYTAIFVGAMWDPYGRLERLPVAVVASMAFMSVMYFFNVCLGKVGSYLMLIFMVLQLGGSAGTYPLELSSDFYHMIESCFIWLSGFRYTKITRLFYG